MVRMSQYQLRRDGETSTRKSDQLPDDGDSSVVWQFGGGQVAPAAKPAQNLPPSELVAIYSGADGVARAAAVRHALDLALVGWWSEGIVPTPGLLRDGLLVLEAGHPLDEGHRTLLLRAALLRKKGVVTALRHQLDPERSALVLREALLLQPPLLTASDLLRLRREDANSSEWAPLLAAELRTEIVTLPSTRTDLSAALAVLTGDLSESPQSEQMPDTVTVSEDRTDRSWWRMLLLAGLFAVFAIVLTRQYWPNRPEGIVSIPAGSYPVGDPARGEQRRLDLSAFAVERLEVTNAHYLICMQAGACPAPASESSATHVDYLRAADFANHPVVNVPWSAAVDYCEWAGRRLPTADEWEVAASYAPATDRAYRFPWGDQFEPQYFIGSDPEFQDTATVGSRSPVGDSPFGLADMAGNVAEWTASPATADGLLMVVKGGAYRDAAEAMMAAAVQSVDKSQVAPWLGFRCAMSIMEDRR
jgi:formylglycine-generating enzyme required for sulfatase activity